MLDVIATHTDKDSGLAWPSLETIARETGLHKRKVPARICRLEEKGVLEIVQRGGKGIGGRGRANVYRIIPDEEAARRASQPAAQADPAAEAAAVNGALPGPEAAAGNGALFGSETVPFLAVNGALPGTPTDREQNLEQNLPCGEGRARTREGSRPQSRSVRQQRDLLLPLNGTKAPSVGRSALDLFEAYRPPPEIVSMARDLGVDDVGKVIDKWRYWHCRDDKPFPRNPEASLRKWILDEPHFARNRGSQKPGGSPLLKAVLEEAEIDD